MGFPENGLYHQSRPREDPHASRTRYPARPRSPTGLDPMDRRRPATERLLRPTATHGAGPLPAVGRLPRTGRLGRRPAGHRLGTRDRSQRDPRHTPRGPTRTRMPTGGRTASPPAPPAAATLDPDRHRRPPPPLLRGS